MLLDWEAPKLNGGAEVTGYFVDMRKVTAGVPGSWHEVNAKAINTRSYKVCPTHFSDSVRCNLRGVLQGSTLGTHSHSSSPSSRLL